MCRRNILTIAAVVMFTLAAPANAELINVNIDTTARTESTLDGPIYGTGGGDVGTTWNQILGGPGGISGLSGTDLVDSTNAATTVDFTSDPGSLYDWGTPDLEMLTGGAFQWIPTDPQTLTISGLTGSEKYDLYIASFHPNELGNRALFSTDNTTTTVGTQIADSDGGGGNDSTWVEGENYVLFKDVEPDDSNEIVVTIVGDWPTTEKRAYLSGFQLKIASPELPGQATNPSPTDGATRIWTGADVILNWTAGWNSDSSDVYFGTDPTPDSGEFQGNQVETSFNAGTLDAEMTYYWRIDAVNNDGTTTGEVWSFTTNEAPSSGMNTFLVPIPVPGASWEELAYLAAVPASAAANTGGPSVIALDESGTIPDAAYDYLTLYNPTAYMIDTNSSLDEVACYLAQTFWTTTTTVVLCDENDYPGALAASALAGRMEVPLLYFDASGLSSAVLDVINNDLQCATALTVNGNSTVTSQLSGISVSQTSLADDKEIITWMGNNGYPVEYLAVCNTNDRGMSDYAPKGSLAAALLAAERNGAVAALTYDTEWNVPFFHSSQTTEKPAGLPANADPPYMFYEPEDINYPIGSFTLNGETHDFVICRVDTLDHAFIDFNDDGDYGDAGESCPRTSEVTLNGKRYTVGVNSERDWVILYGELRFSHPSDDELKEDLQGYHDQIGHHPKYMAMVGVLQVLPCAHALSYDTGHCDYVMTDNYFADVDDDPLFEIAMGRIVGENVTYTTLNATRCLTYNDLYLPWADNMAHMCPEEFAISLYNTPRQFENCGFSVDDWYTIPTQDRTIYGVFIQDEHGWPFGIEPPTFGPIAPSLVEAGGCNIAAIDEYSTTHAWYDTNAVVLARRGAICLNAWVRGTGASKDWTRDNFYKAILYDGATLGEAHLHALNTMAAEDENWDDSYELNGNMFYGDPAVTLYTPPAGPTYAAANVTANGNTLTVNAPGTYWVDYIEPQSVYAYTAPGLAGSVYEPAWTLSATYTTGLQITNMTQESGVPSPLGWMEMREGQDYVIDEHWDNTRTIHWRIRLDEFNSATGQFVQTIDDIDYTLTTSSSVDPPTVVNSAATNITSSAARLNGQVTDTGGENPTVTIYWGDNDGGTTPESWDNSENMGTQSGTFYKDISSLDPATTYYFRCYATNSGGSDWADSTAQFDTDAAAPMVVNSAATNITSSAARLNGEVTDTGGENPTVTIYWGDNDGGTTPGSWDNSENMGTQSGTFYEDISSLDPSTTYYFRCYATNSGGSDWADSTAQFDTLAGGGPATLLDDDFEGTLGNWSTDWDLDTDYYVSSSHSIECSSRDNDLISDDLDTSSYSSITITFKYRIDDIDTGDDIRVQYYNGSDYVNIEEIGDDAEDVWLTYDHTTYDSQYLKSNFRLKIEGSSIDSGENLWVDDVLITVE